MKEHACRLCREKWHAMEEQNVFEVLQSCPEGLNVQEAVQRLLLYGPNTLPAKEPTTIWAILLHQIFNPLIFILLAAAVASLAIGEVTDALFILIVITLNSVLGAYQEYQAEKGAASLQRLLKIRAWVRRNNVEHEIPSEKVVPGDIVLLVSGNKAPADLRLIQSNNLTSDESFLTGESLAAHKQTDLLPEDTGVSDRKNMVFAGSTITSGRGVGIVVGTGSETQVGMIAETVARSESGKPPLVIRMERFVKHVSILVLGVTAGIALLLLSKGGDATAIFFFVVALAVSAIPEGLPVALTVALSIATKRMFARNVIVRKLTAVESLGSCTVIASDKTGTLTVNQQTARMIVLADGQSFTVSGEGYNGEGKILTDKDAELSESVRNRLRVVAELAILANEGTLLKENENWKHRGDAMDVACLAMSYKLGINPLVVRQEFPVVEEIPYESERKFSAAFYEWQEKRFVAAKGAAETILDFCNLMLGTNGLEKLDRKGIEHQVETMAKKGLRVLAVAGGEATGIVNGETEPSDLVFQGLIGFIDPLRPEAVEAVKKCKTAGIKVIMVTGDHPATAGAVARELGLSGVEEVTVTGRELSEAGTPDSPAFERLIVSSSVFARVSPTQKLEIVEVLIRCGEFVAVTGDGVNDAPALRRANIGVAMGSGTDVAKEVGSMIVADDNFASIVSGVEEGRFAYDNVRKVIYLLISTGAAEVLMFIAAILAGLPIPLLAVQLLWLNLVTNGIQDVALAFEGGEPGAMQRKPRRPNESIFDFHMITQTLVSGLTIGAVTFGFWYWLISNQGVDETSARNMVLLLMVLLQNLHVFNCRSETISAFNIPFRRNYILILGILAAQGIHVMSMHLPLMQAILHIEPVRFTQWVAILALALTVIVVMEIFKWMRRQSESSVV